jgi:hypothetical protein
VITCIAWAFPMRWRRAERYHLTSRSTHIVWHRNAREAGPDHDSAARPAAGPLIAVGYGRTALVSQPSRAGDPLRHRGRRGSPRPPGPPAGGRDSTGAAWSRHPDDPAVAGRATASPIRPGRSRRCAAAGAATPGIVVRRRCWSAKGRISLSTSPSSRSMLAVSWSTCSRCRRSIRAWWLSSRPRAPTASRRSSVASGSAPTPRARPGHAARRSAPPASRGRTCQARPTRRSRA